MVQEPTKGRELPAPLFMLRHILPQHVLTTALVRAFQLLERAVLAQMKRRFLALPLPPALIGARHQLVSTVTFHVLVKVLAANLLGAAWGWALNDLVAAHLVMSSHSLALHPKPALGVGAFDLLCGAFLQQH